MAAARGRAAAARAPARAPARGPPRQASPERLVCASPWAARPRCARPRGVRLGQPRAQSSRGDSSGQPGAQTRRPRLRLAGAPRAAAWALAALAGLRSRGPRPTAGGGADWSALALPPPAGTGWPALAGAVWLAPALPSRVPGLRTAAAGRGRAVRRVGLAEPPTVTRPPDVGAEVSTRRAEWTECLINDPVRDGEADGGALRVETWVFRTSDYGDFERLLKLRGGTFVGSEHAVRCRERQVDEQMRCAQCVRLLRGGFYGSLGVSVQAYPPQPEAVGCLALSKVIDMPSPATEEDDSGDWDGDEGRQTAFCNTVNARFEKMDA